MKNPLVHGFSQGAFDNNVSMEIRHGKGPGEATAIAYRIGRAAWRKKHPSAAFPEHLKRKQTRKNVMARKKKRTAKQIAATKKMRAGLKRWKAGKKTRSKKRRNPVRKKRKVAARKKSTRSAKSHLWLVFACKGKAVKFVTFKPAAATIGRLSYMWSSDKAKALLVKTKEQARKMAGKVKKPGAGTWQIGAASDATTVSQIRDACIIKM